MDSLLLHRVAQAEQAAVRECLDRYGGLVWSLVRRYAPEEGAAEEAIQDIFMELWRVAGRFDPAVCSEILFVTMVTRRRLLERGRARGKRRDVEVPDVLGEGRQRQRLPEMTREAAIAAHALGSLGREHRQALVLACAYGLSYEEIATATAETTADVRIKAREGIAYVRDTLVANSPRRGAQG